MTTRRLPAVADHFVTGPAEAKIARISPFARKLLEGMQAAAEQDDRVPDWRKHARRSAAGMGEGHGALVWYAGGCVRAAVDGSEPLDLDVFFADDDAHVAAMRFVASSFAHKPVVERDVACKFVVDANLVQDDLMAPRWVHVDLVRRYHGTPLDAARHMDFVCCSAALSTMSFARHVDFEADTRSRILRVNAPWRPQASRRRVDRFLRRGWSIAPEELKRLDQLAADPNLPEWDFVNAGGKPDGVESPEDCSQ